MSKEKKTKMVCQVCGYEGRNGAKFCANDGSPLVAVTIGDPVGKRKWILAAAVLLIAIAGILVWNSPVNQTVRAIDAIGSVTLDSEEAIEAAEGLYGSLDPDHRERVKNGAELTEARKAYDSQKKLFDTAVEAVRKLGQVTLDSGPAIQQARNKLETAKQYDVSSLLSDTESQLIQAEEQYAQLKQAHEEFLQDAQSSADSAEKMVSAGNYTQARDIVLEYFDQLPDGSLKNRFAEILVSALCGQAQEQFDRGKLQNAMKSLVEANAYTALCSQTVQNAYGALSDRFLSELTAKAPKNGEILDRTYGAGRNTIEITAGPMDTCVKLELVEDPTKYVTVYIRANQKTKLNILNGEYRLKYTCGPVWYDKEDMFGDYATIIQMTDTIDPFGYTDSMYYHWTSYTWEITTGYGEEWGYQNITLDQF
ncbi:MAG: hypothetical protein ACI4PH_08830 [Faecousia sp.]